MKKSFIRSVFAALVAFASASAMAQFDLNQGTADVDTKVAIKQTGPGAAELTITGVKLVYLNRDPKVDGIKPQADKSGKGKVWIVDPKAAPADAEGADVYLTGVGRGGWAVMDGGKVNTDKAKGVKLAGEYVLPITINGRGGCAGFTFLAAKGGNVIKDVWVSHPGNASYQLKRGNGANDMVTVLCVDKDGNITPATADQAKAYAPVYTEVTTAVLAKK